MSDEEKLPQGTEPPVGERHDSTQVVEDARARALAEALQGSFKVIRVLMVVLTVAFLGSGITKVGSGEQALLLRFGEFKRPLGPGLHFAWPNPIDRIVKVDVSKNVTITSDVGWSTAEGEEPQDGFSFDPNFDGYTLTGKGNTVHIKAVMNFSLEDSEKAIKAYAFNFDDTAVFLQSALDNAVYHASANRSALDAEKRKMDSDGNRLGKTLEEDIRNRVKKVVNEAHELPIKVNSLTLSFQVPEGVKSAYLEFGDAETKRNEKVVKAQTEAGSIVTKAEGDAKVIQSGGETTKRRFLTTVEAEARSFTEQRPYYESNPELFRQRLLTGTMQRVLTNAVDVFYLSGRQPRIWLNRTPEKPKLKEGGAP
ncbi:MAG: SPFH domain-containing protein [Verrucomicrobiota bacterium]|nr:SPFH domain-containing protein [Verrucomicrobiota bacterium]MDP7048539.1 SPFH domain-containing protein [Verrucomicrobiota bacterium]